MRVGCIHHRRSRPEEHAVVIRRRSRPDLFLRPAILPVKGVRSVGPARVLEAQRPHAQRLALALVVGREARRRESVLLQRRAIVRIGLRRITENLRRPRLLPSVECIGQQRLRRGRQHQRRRRPLLRRRWLLPLRESNCRSRSPGPANPPEWRLNPSKETLPVPCLAPSEFQLLNRTAPQPSGYTLVLCLD